MPDDVKQIVKRPNAVKRLWTETIGELRRVTWPTVAAARRLTVIVLAVMVATSVALGLLDFIFAKVITALLA
jgi:preprotein translocase subunit SecE